MRVVSAENTEARHDPEKWFTDVVYMDAAPAGSSPDAGIFRVLFEPGSQINWHICPEGQILYVVTGVGRAKKEGGPVAKIRSGDVVYFAPGEKH